MVRCAYVENNNRCKRKADSRCMISGSEFYGKGVCNRHLFFLRTEGYWRKTEDKGSI